MTHNSTPTTEEVSIVVATNPVMLRSATATLMLMTAGATLNEYGRMDKEGHEKALDVLQNDTYGESIIRAAGVIMILVNEIASATVEEDEEPDDTYVDSIFKVINEMRAAGLTGKTDMELPTDQAVHL